MKETGHEIVFIEIDIEKIVFQGHAVAHLVEALYYS
jgi:hypothetical protein